jgi:hypothetical protein
MSKIIAVSTHEEQIRRVVDEVAPEQEGNELQVITPVDFYKLGQEGQRKLLDGSDVVIADHTLLTSGNISVKPGTLVYTKELLEEAMAEQETHPAMIWMNEFGMPDSVATYPSYTASSGSDSTLRIAVKKALNIDEHIL